MSNPELIPQTLLNPYTTGSILIPNVNQAIQNVITDSTLTGNGRTGTALGINNTYTSNVEAKALAQFTGALTYPTVTGVGTNTLTIGTFTAWIIFIDSNTGALRKEIWTYPGGTYTPTYPGGADAQITYVAIVPDFTTKDTTKTFKYIEYSFYRNFPLTEVKDICIYFPTTRDTGTNLITNILRYALGSQGSPISHKLITYKSGSIRLDEHSYEITAEPTNFDGATGSFFNIARGGAETAGRNYLNSLYDTNKIFDSYNITNDPAVQGASASLQVAVAGRGTIGNEGQQFYRTSGAAARCLGTATAPMLEPNNANSTADYTLVSNTKWGTYRLVIFPGSRLVIVQPHTVNFNSQAEAIAATHIYETSEFINYDRWIPCLHVGYMVLRNNFDPALSWTANAGLYAFYDWNKALLT